MKTSKKLNIRRFIIGRKKSFLSLAIFVMVVLVSSIIINPLILPYFSTPIEDAVRKSNNQLTEQYNKMLSEVDMLEEVLGDVSRRDANMYRQIFGVELSVFNTSNTTNTSKGDSLSKKSFSELASLLITKTETLENEVSCVGEKLKNAVQATDNPYIRQIPSMQPTNNSDFSHNITPTGMRINPFVKSFVFHKGIDYAISEGTRIYATADGKVSAIRSQGKEGGTIEIDHYNGYTTVYGNLSNIGVKKGSKVTRGQIIGNSGNTGSSFLPHLHYEVRYKKNILDPMDFFFGELTQPEIAELKKISEQNIQSFD